MCVWGRKRPKILFFSTQKKKISFTFPLLCVHVRANPLVGSIFSFYCVFIYYINEELPSYLLG